VGVGEAREGVGLSAEAGAGALVGERALRGDLEGDVAVELQVVGALDLAHASCPEALDHAVVGEGAADHSAPPVELDDARPEPTTVGAGGAAKSKTGRGAGGRGAPQGSGVRDSRVRRGVAVKY
jgi:hypothetical protein